MLNQLSQTQWDQNYMVSLQNINLKCVGGYALLSHKTKKEILRGQEEIFRQVENTGKDNMYREIRGRTAGDGVGGGAERNEDRV